MLALNVTGCLSQRATDRWPDADCGVALAGYRNLLILTLHYIALSLLLLMLAPGVEFFHPSITDGQTSKTYLPPILLGSNRDSVVLYACRMGQLRVNAAVLCLPYWFG